jgi:hypothetical protein
MFFLLGLFFEILKGGVSKEMFIIPFLGVAIFSLNIIPRVVCQKFINEYFSRLQVITKNETTYKYEE